ncbi:LCP family protein [Metabacillus lacus]
MVQSASETELPAETYEFDGKKDKNGSTNILLLGSDSRGEEKARTDTIMIAQFNSKNNTQKIVSIMRDTYVDIPGHGKNKINAAYAYGGPELLRKTIKQNFDVDLQYYTIVDFVGFQKAIDTAFPDGVEVNVEKRMSKNIGVTLEPGKQKLDGAHLLGYVRFRGDAVGDFGRVDRQQEVMKALADQLISVQGVTKIPKMAGVITPYVNTNLKTTDIVFMGTDALTGGAGNIDSLRIPVDGSFENKRYSGAGAVLDINTEKNKQALKEFLNEN